MNSSHLIPKELCTRCGACFAADRKGLLSKDSQGFHGRSMTLKDYLSLFESELEHRAVGEASAGYLYFHEEVIPRIRKDLESPKIIIMLRDPVARAFSSHLHHMRNNHDPISFEDALDLEEVRLRDNMWFGCQLRGVGMYAKQVKAYLEAFEDVLIVVAEDLRENREGELRRVYDFLGVDVDFEVEDSNEQNVGRVPRSWVVEAVCRRTLRYIGEFPGVSKVVNCVRKLNDYRPKLNPSTARRLAADFEADVVELGELLGRDFSFWLKKYN